MVPIPSGNRYVHAIHPFDCGGGGLGTRPFSVSRPPILFMVK